MQGTIVMLMALSGLGCHHKSCDVAYAPSYYGTGACYGGCYGGLRRSSSRRATAAATPRLRLLWRLLRQLLQRLLWRLLRQLLQRLLWRLLRQLLQRPAARRPAECAVPLLRRLGRKLEARLWPLWPPSCL